MLVPFLQVSGRAFVLFAMIESEPRMQTKPVVFYLFLVWSLIEVVRWIWDLAYNTAMIWVALSGGRSHVWFPTVACTWQLGRPVDLIHKRDKVNRYVTCHLCRGLASEWCYYYKSKLVIQVISYNIGGYRRKFSIKNKGDANLNLRKVMKFKKVGTYSNGKMQARIAYRYLQIDYL